MSAYPGCAEPRLLDRTSPPVGFSDVHGRMAIDNGLRHCYHRRHGCLARLYRVTELSFRAICKRREQ